MHLRYSFSSSSSSFKISSRLPQCSQRQLTFWPLLAAKCTVMALQKLESAISLSRSCNFPMAQSKVTPFNLMLSSLDYIYISSNFCSKSRVSVRCRSISLNYNSYRYLIFVVIYIIHPQNLLMEEKQPDTNLNFIHNFDSLEVTKQKFGRETNEQLLNKGSPEKNAQTVYRQPTSQKKLVLNEYEHGVSNEEFCFPKFLSKVGLCCVPCKVYCPCMFCACCLCKSNPLFQQDMKSLGLLQDWGRFEKMLEPGLHIINPISQSIIQINQQTQLLEYKQIGISRDNVQFDLSVVIFYRVIDSLKLAYRLGDYDVVNCLTQIATGTLRSVLGQNILQAIIENRELITQKFTEELNRQVKYWGLYVQICSLKEITIDKEVQRTLQAVTETKRRSQAMIINFKAEVECSKLIKEISQIINNQASFQIRYLNMVEGILSNSSQENIVIMKTQMDKAYEKMDLNKC